MANPYLHHLAIKLGKESMKNLYASGSRRTGATPEINPKITKKNARITKHEPTYIFDNANRDVVRNLEKFLHTGGSKKTALSTGSFSGNAKD